jgi:uncharacterized protein
MSEHPNVQRLRDGYEAFGKGDFAALDDLFAEDITWHVSGRSQLAGDYEGRAAVYAFFGRLMEVTENSFQLELRKIFADDTQAAVVVTSTARRGTTSSRTTDVHLYRMQDGRIVEFQETTSDQYAVDAVYG